MLVLFNLDWARLSIDAQISAANNYMRELTLKAGLSQRVFFNLASMGAGEHILAFNDVSNHIKPDVIDSLRCEHHRLKAQISSDPVFRLNRETAEMVYSLKKTNHDVAAVSPVMLNDLEKYLENARCRDVFADSVYGYNNLSGLNSDFTSVGVCRAAFNAMHIAPVDAMIVTDTPDGVIEAKSLRPRIVVGYVPSAEGEAQKDTHIKELCAAGADYTLIGGYTVAMLPHVLSAFASHQRTKLDVNAMLNGLKGRNFE